MKPSTLILLIFLTIVFLYVVVIFKTFTPANNAQIIAREISPPLDTSIISELEKRIAYEHAKFLDVSEKFESGRLQMKSLITELESLHQHENQIIGHGGHHEDGAANSTLLKIIESRNAEIKDLTSAIETLQKQSREHQQGDNNNAANPDSNIPPLQQQPAIVVDQSSQSHLSKTITLSRPASTSTPLSLSPVSRPGVIVLGMHRSGTSVIGGLMTKMGLNTGGPLIGAAKDNEKGFFERIDVVLQNDELFRNQNVHYSFNTHKYDALIGLKDILTNQNAKFFSEGRRALKFLNDEKSFPWMLKDPRLCITLRTWLPILNFVPAILFAYRNPYDVALSMHTRETEHFTIQRGLKLWYIYNKRAIKQSNDLCRVVTSHKRMLTDPKTETIKIFEGLRKCGVEVPHTVSDTDIKSFVDTSLQHGKTKTLDTLCSQENVDFDTLMPPDTWSTTDPSHLHLYRACIKAFCDIENGIAFLYDYNWDESITNS